MKKHLILTCVSIAALCGCVSPPHTTFRASADGTREILYLHPFVALAARRVQKEQKANPNAPDFAYYLARARWLNEPELAAHTGDTEEGLVGSVSELGWSPMRNVIFGVGRNPEADWLDTSATFFVLSLDRVEFFSSRREMIEALRGLGISNVETERAEDFFTKHKKAANTSVHASAHRASAMSTA
ncbi:MAG: hypothetical protein HN341_14515 [Verrucomicrobia bacterium]|jgi:hypothetical protein|nr:hypothetical protein [Verrucomicrobiota bacterium]